VLGVFLQKFTFVSEQRPFQLARAFDLPQRIAAMLDPVEIVQPSDARQQRQLLSVERW
jgi:hypothetical protein